MQLLRLHSVQARVLGLLLLSTSGEAQAAMATEAQLQAQLARQEHTVPAVQEGRLPAPLPVSAALRQIIGLRPARERERVDAVTAK
jgi:hypothetical protein